MPEKPKRILAIEAAIRGGSIALLDGGHEIDSLRGTTDVSRAEDLLANIAGMLERTRIDKKTLDLIAVSNGPGSYTGIRIGLATALGLHNALEIPCFGVSLLAAMAAAHEENGAVVVAVPMGRDELCWQIFEKSSQNLRELDPAQVGNLNTFNDLIDRMAGVAVLLHNDLWSQFHGLSNSRAKNQKMVKYPSNLAYAIGRAAEDSRVASDLQPFYVRNPRYTPGFS